MKIYTLKPDTDYRLMYPEDEVYSSNAWEFKAKPLIERLPKTFKANWSDSSTDKPKPDIAYLGMLTIAFRKEVASELVDILEAAGELLPFTVDDELWYCLNVTTTAEDAIDQDNSKYAIVHGDIKMNLLEYAFHTDKLPESSLFKIKDDNYTNIFCADRRDSDDDVMGNLFCAIAGHGYTGVKFEPIFEG